MERKIENHMPYVSRQLTPNPDEWRVPADYWADAAKADREQKRAALKAQVARRERTGLKTHSRLRLEVAVRQRKLKLLTLEAK